MPLRGVFANTCLHGGPVLAQQRLAKQRHGLRVGVAHLLALVNQQHATRQHGHQRSQPLQQPLFLGQFIESGRTRGRELLVEPRYPRLQVAVGRIQLMGDFREAAKGLFQIVFLEGYSLLHD